MLITLSPCTAICLLVAEVYLIDVAPLGAVSHRFNFFNNIILKVEFILLLGNTD